LFPYLPGQSGYGKRLRAMGGLLSAVITELARDTPSWHDSLRLLDSTPLPCAASRETVKRSDLAGHAGYGYCASHSRFFWGLRLYLITTAEGMPIIWGMADPKLGEREVTRALLEHDHHLIASEQVIVADKGFAGRDFEQFVTTGLSAHLIPADRKDEPTRLGKLARVRQWIEAIIDTLKGQLTLEDHGARTLTGVYARVGVRLLALAAAIWHNWTTDAPVKRSLTAYDH
jgi:Transposase DDE domain